MRRLVECICGDEKTICIECMSDEIERLRQVKVVGIISHTYRDELATIEYYFFGSEVDVRTKLQNRKDKFIADGYTLDRNKYGDYVEKGWSVYEFEILKLDVDGHVVDF